MSKVLWNKSDQSNMKYLDLSEEQYEKWLELWSMVIGEWPEELRQWIKDHHAGDPVCGDALGCWIAEWIKSKYKQTKQLCTTESKRVRFLRPEKI